MARSRRSKRPKEKGGNTPRGTQVARAGLGALVLGGLAWMLGGFTRENAVEWGKTILIAGSLALIIRWSIAEPFRIPSGSMEPTLRGHPNFLIGDRVFVNKWRYGLRYPLTRTRIYYGQAPRRWDVVVFKTVEEGTSKTTLVKRIAGMPGERVHLKGGQLYVNNEPVPFPSDMPEEMYYTNELEMGAAGEALRMMGHPERMRYGVLPDDEYSLIPEGHYFLLGDNSAQSRDGRFWGWVPNEHMLGPVTCVWWPPFHMRDFTGFTRTWWWRCLTAGLGLLVLIRLFLGRSWHVRSGAIQSVVLPGEHVFINRCAFGWPVPFTFKRLTKGRAPRRGESVLYRSPDAAHGEMLLGHVVGMPGERVQLDGAVLHIDDVPVLEPSVLSEMRFDAPPESAPYGRSRSKEYSLVPEGHYFVLGEAPDEEPDSRILGWVPHENIVGSAMAVWWPPARWRRIRL